MAFANLWLASLALSGISHALSRPTTSVTFQMQASAALPNPNLVPASTRASLTSLHAQHRAPLSTTNSFTFRNVSAGSYLVDISCPTHAFAPLRLDVLSAAVGDGAGEEAGPLVPRAWETFRGNDWDNKGQPAPFQAGVFEIRAAGPKNYFLERSKFSVLSILRNPMILLGLVSMAIFLGMPYLVDNMDPEMRAEWEEQQKSNPVTALMGAASGQPGSGPASNFDMAAFLAGSKSKKPEESGGATAGMANKGESRKKR